MLKNLKKKLNLKKGFTIIELMIVIAIITILALVLIPKANVGKNAAKDTGVVSNINSTIGVAENYINKQDASIAKDAVNTGLSVLTKDGSDKMKNPMDKADATPYVVDDTSKAKACSARLTEIIAEKFAPTGEAKQGRVVVDVCSDGLVIYGVDHTNKAINAKIVK